MCPDYFSMHLLIYKVYLFIYLKGDSAHLSSFCNVYVLELATNSNFHR